MDSLSPLDGVAHKVAPPAPTVGRDDKVELDDGAGNHGSGRLIVRLGAGRPENLKGVVIAGGSEDVDRAPVTQRHLVRPLVQMEDLPILVEAAEIVAGLLGVEIGHRIDDDAEGPVGPQLLGERVRALPVRVELVDRGVEAELRLVGCCSRCGRAAASGE